MQSLTLISFILYRQLKISNANYFDETTIHVDTILYLSLYYLVNDLLHLRNPTINVSCIFVHAKHDSPLQEKPPTMMCIRCLTIMILPVRSLIKSLYSLISSLNGEELGTRVWGVLNRCCRTLVADGMDESGSLLFCCSIWFRLIKLGQE